MVYVDDPELKFEKPQTVWTGKDFKKSKSLVMLEFHKQGDPINTARDISAFETELYKKTVKNRIYTLFVGPQEYSDGILRVRVGIALGIHRK